MAKLPDDHDSGSRGVSNLKSASSLKSSEALGISIDRINEARKAIAGSVERTPLVHAAFLSEALGCDLYLKLENLQYTGSFKDRGALYRLLNLTEEEKKRGVVAMSAGNHAQGVALHARSLGISATIVMPEGAPFSKIEATRNLGAEVELYGDTLDDSRLRVEEIITETNMVFIHPYDDPYVISGQGTIGLEILDDQPDIDTVVVPIGGGGILSGVATAVRATKSDVEFYGVEAGLYPSMSEALGMQGTPCGGSTVADGIAVKEPGKITRQIIREAVRDIFLVDESEIEKAILHLAEKQKVVAEGAGASGVAAIMANAEYFKGRKIATVICGGNIDARMLSGLLLRGMMRTGRVVRIRNEMVDRPGVMATISKIIASSHANIIDVIHQRHFYDIPAKFVEIDYIVETRDWEHAHDIVAKLREAGFNSCLRSMAGVPL